jgi:hypothetical protein
MPTEIRTRHRLRRLILLRYSFKFYMQISNIHVFLFLNRRKRQSPQRSMSVLPMIVISSSYLLVRTRILQGLQIMRTLLRFDHRLRLHQLPQLQLLQPLLLLLRLVLLLRPLPLRPLLMYPRRPLKPNTLKLSIMIFTRFSNPCVLSRPK